MAMDVLGIAESALAAFQTGVAIGSRNIADSADPNYSREIIECSSLLNGDLNVEVKRISDHFLSTQMNLAQSGWSQYGVSSPVLDSIDRFVTGLNGSDADGPYNLIGRSAQQFFDSLGTLSATVNGSTKQGVVSQADLLSRNLKSASDYINVQRDHADQNITDSVAQINALTTQIAQLNSKLNDIGGTPTPDLLDQRDKLIGELSQYVGVSTSESGNMLNVSLLNGSSLVSGTVTSSMSVQRDAYNNKVLPALSGSPLSLNADTLSGKLAGYLYTRNEAIPEITQKLGLFAATLTTAFNQQNAAGYVSPNTHGGNIFSPITAEGIANKNNVGDAKWSVSVDPAHMGDLQAASYIVTETGSGQYQVTNNTTGKVTSGFTSFPITIDGLSIAQTSGTMSVGDDFRVDLMSQAAGAVQVTAGPSDIALSSQADAIGTANVVALAGLSNQKIFGGLQSFSDQLGTTFSDIGTLSSMEAEKFNGSKAAFTQAKNDKQSLTGVNTQEEYMNIVHFQQSYAAAAKIITVDQQMFTSMLSVLGE